MSITSWLHASSFQQTVSDIDSVCVGIAQLVHATEFYVKVTDP